MRAARVAVQLADATGEARGPARQIEVELRNRPRPARRESGATSRRTRCQASARHSRREALQRARRATRVDRGDDAAASSIACAAARRFEKVQTRTAASAVDHKELSSSARPTSKLKEANDKAPPPSASSSRAGRGRCAKTDAQARAEAGGPRRADAQANRWSHRARADPANTASCQDRRRGLRPDQELLSEMRRTCCSSKGAANLKPTTHDADGRQASKRSSTTRERQGRAARPADLANARSVSETNGRQRPHETRTNEAARARSKTDQGAVLADLGHISRRDPGRRGDAQAVRRARDAARVWSIPRASRRSPTAGTRDVKDPMKAIDHVIRAEGRRCSCSRLPPFLKEPR